MRASLEITDVIVDYDEATLARRPVTKADARERLRRSGASAGAVRCVERLPEKDGALDPEAVDQIMVSAHAEMQRLWETMRQGARVALVLRAMVDAARAAGVEGPLQVVDVGCGCGYVLRWLSAHQALGPEVTLLGVDYNQALVTKAKQLAALEDLDCHFEVANAFELSTRADIFISTGVAHHFEASALPAFFRAQAARSPLGFAHFDARQSWLSPIGAWLFHKAKFRGAIGQHDGYMSAVRAHSTEVLLAAAREGAPEMRSAEYNRPLRFLPFLRAMHGIVAVREDLTSALEVLP